MKTQRVVVYANGIIHCSVCAPKDMPIEEVQREVNTGNPTGTEHRWHLSSDKFSSGQPNPSPCDASPDERVHYLMVY